MRNEAVAVIGDALIDEIQGETGSHDFVGGAALNVAVGLAILGLPTCLIAMVGDDDDGAAIRRHLADYGVRLLPSPAPHGTSRAVSVRVGGEPTYEFNEAAQRRAVVIGDAERAVLDVASHVVISCFPLDDADQRELLLAEVTDRSRRLIVDPNPRAGMMHDPAEFRRGIERVAADCRLLKLGDDDGALLYGRAADELAPELIALGAGTVLTTAGPAGAALHRAGAAVHRAPIAAGEGPIVDTMGAGDATLAAITARVIAADAAGEPVDWPRALAFAMQVAALTCRAPGALLRAPASR